LMRRLKTALDPDDILNPGVILPAHHSPAATG
jgi:FAD/FMN-containing dehydrogenase